MDSGTHFPASSTMSALPYSIDHASSVQNPHLGLSPNFFSAINIPPYPLDQYISSQEPLSPDIGSKLDDLRHGLKRSLKEFENEGSLLESPQSKRLRFAYESGFKPGENFQRSLNSSTESSKQTSEYNLKLAKDIVADYQKKLRDLPYGRYVCLFGEGGRDVDWAYKQIANASSWQVSKGHKPAPDPISNVARTISKRVIQQYAWTGPTPVQHLQAQALRRS